MNPNNPGGPPGGYPPGGYPPGYPPNQAPGYPPPQQQPAYGYPGPQPPQGAPGMPYGAPPGQPGMPYGASPQGQPGMPYGAPPGMPGPGMHGMMPQNAMMAARLGGAQASLAKAGGMLKTMQIVFIVIGALMAVGGAIMIPLVDIGGGIGLLITGVVFVLVAKFTLPRFMGQLGGATAMVNALAAKENLAMTGIPTTAQVVAAQQTGTMVNMNPQVACTLMVNGPQGPYQVQTTAIVPMMNIAQFQPGMAVNVRVNPQNPMDVAVVF